MDSQRSEWNDRAIDQLDGRVENLERDIDGLRDEQREAEVREARRISQAREYTREYVDHRLTEHAPKVSLRSALVTGAEIVVPIVVALIAAYAAIKAGLPAGPSR